MKRLLLADALNIKPSSTNFRDLLSSSYKYGLTNGTEKADFIELTPLGKTITIPTSEETLTQSKQKAALTPEALKIIYTYYKDKGFPNGQFFENTLISEFGIPREYVQEATTLLWKNGQFSGIIREISGSPHVILGDTSKPETKEQNIDTGKKKESAREVEITRDKDNHRKQDHKENLPIFIAHGKDRRPLEQLEKILEQFKIKYKVAINEAHKGRPVSQKVREIMQECGSAIFIFSKKGEALTSEGDHKPNSNVVFELGAASVLYGDKLIVFKEEGLELASDYGDLTYHSKKGH